MKYPFPTLSSKAAKVATDADRFAVANKTNVRNVAKIMQTSPVIAHAGTVKLIYAEYDLASGKMELLLHVYVEESPAPGCTGVGLLSLNGSCCGCLGEVI